MPQPSDRLCRVKWSSEAYQQRFPALHAVAQQLLCSLPPANTAERCDECDPPERRRRRYEGPDRRTEPR